MWTDFGPDPGGKPTIYFRFVLKRSWASGLGLPINIVQWLGCLVGCCSYWPEVSLPIGLLLVSWLGLGNFVFVNLLFVDLLLSF